ncbi:MAG: DASS family sodium-coupled anion symporter [Deltaproteobacteria bacterium]|nr:DASS family sodium-coupled anion symporter [Deltaproteobacteria bacterium]MCB9786749.1 DASS family sodium-coupled anion symporter [Deltaproteobacteria bacterium]
MSEARYEIDRRPILIVLVSRLRRQLWIGVLLTLFFLLLGLSPPQGLTTAGWGTLCVFALCATLYATALLPLAITSLLAIALVPMLGILGARETYAFFGSKVVFFILGAFMLSAAMSVTGLSERAATVFVRRFGGTPRRLVLSVFFLCAVGSTVMSEHAVAVMVFPIVRDIARALDLRQSESNMGRGLFFGMFWGCVVGGSLTVLGGGRGPLAIGILEEATQHTLTVGFLEYSLFALPMVIVLLLTGVTLLWRHFPPEIASTATALAELEERLRRMGKVTPREGVVGLVLVITVGLWAVAGEEYGLANIALVSMAALFALGALKWMDVQKHVDWGLVVMYGGAICLGSTMERTGAALWLTEQVFDGVGVGPQGLMMLIALGAAVATEFMSNSAVVAMLLPPALSLAEQKGIDLRAMTMAVVLPTNFAFLLPIATPVAALAWTSGYFRPRVVLRTGLVLNVFAWLAMALLIYGWWPAVGLY